MAKFKIDYIGWLLLLFLLLPSSLLYSPDLLDPVLSIRMLGISIGAFVFLLVTFLKNEVILIGSNFLKFLFAYFALLVVCGIGFLFAESRGEVLSSMGRLQIPILVFIFYAFLKKESRILLVSRALLFVAWIHLAITFFQYMEVGFLYLEPQIALRPYGLMTNRNLLGAFLALLLPFSVYVLLVDRLFWKMLGGITVLGLLSGIFLSSTRSAWLAIIVSIGFTSCLAFIFRKQNPRMTRLWIRTVGATFLLGVFSLIGVMNSSFENYTMNTFKSRINKLIHYKANTARGIGERFEAWEVSMAMFRSNPFLGVGAGNWKVVAPKYGALRIGVPKNEDTIPLRAHNIYISILSELGLLGLLCYLSLWLLIAYGFYRWFAMSDKKLPLKLSMFMGLVIYMVIGMFSFPDERMAHSMLFSMMFGIILGQIPDKSTKQKIPRSWLLLPIILLIGINYLSYSKYRIDRTAREMVQHFLAENYTAAKNVEKPALLFMLNSAGDPFLFDYANAHFMSGDKTAAIDLMEEALSQAPYHPRILNNLGFFYAEARNLEQATTCYERVLDLNPYHKSAALALLELYYKTKNNDALCQLLQQRPWLKEEGRTYWLGLCEK